MFQHRIKPVLMSLHRWIGLVLAPIFLVIILSGAVLSFKPILQSATRPVATAAVDVAALQSRIAGLEALGPVGAIAVDTNGATITVASTEAAIAGRWDLATGAHEAALPKPIDVFAIAEQMHKSLLLGLGFVVEFASFAMLAIILAGPFLAALRFRNTVAGWHRAVGWCLLPVTLIAPVTAVMMTLGIGRGGTPLPRAAQPVTISQALTIAAPTIDLSHIVSARPFRGGTVMLRTSASAPNMFAVTDQAAVPLSGGPGIIQQIHEGTWAGAWSGLLNFAISMALLVLTITGLLSWFRRWRRDRRVEIAAGADILVAHASQTGTATRFADLTAKAIERGGQSVAVAPLGTLAPADLSNYRSVLIIAASTGDGELPDGSRAFLRALRPGTAAGARCAILGLGDRRYERFCGGAEALRDALIAGGADELMPMARADGDPAGTWSQWLADLRAAGAVRGDTAGLAVAADHHNFKLIERHRLDDSTAGDTQETWAVTLESSEDLAFRPGDLLRLSPGAGEPERAYSIGSSARIDPRRIELTVRLHKAETQDGADIFGRMSGNLIRTLPLGASVMARIDQHAGFHPPVDPTWPIIMIGAGSGIAPFPGFIGERKASGRPGPAWLLFGNRHRNGDFLWRERFEAALADGSLSRLDTAFSRDADDGARIQARLGAAADTVVDWLENRKAMVYICGRGDLAKGVMATLAEILSTRLGLTPAAATTELEAWQASGRIRIDAFD